MHPESCRESDCSPQFVAMLADLRNCGISSDHRHDAFIKVMERLFGISCNVHEDVFGAPFP